MLGSGGKVDFLRHFCMRFQFFQIIPETVRKCRLYLLMRTIPDAKLKKPPPKKGWRLFGVLHQDLHGTWRTVRKADI